MYSVGRSQEIHPRDICYCVLLNSIPNGCDSLIFSVMFVGEKIKNCIHGKGLDVWDCRTITCWLCDDDNDKISCCCYYLYAVTYSRSKNWWCHMKISATENSECIAVLWSMMMVLCIWKNLVVVVCVGVEKVSTFVRVSVRYWSIFIIYYHSEKP